MVVCYLKYFCSENVHVSRAKTNQSSCLLSTLLLLLLLLFYFYFFYIIIIITDHCDVRSPDVLQVVEQAACGDVTWLFEVIQHENALLTTRKQPTSSLGSKDVICSRPRIYNVFARQCRYTRSQTSRLNEPIHFCRAMQPSATLAVIRCLSRSITVSKLETVNRLIATLKPQSNGPSNSNIVIGTLAVDGWAVTFGTAMRGLGVAAARPGPSSLYQM